MPRCWRNRASAAHEPQHLETSATGFRRRRVVHVCARFRGRSRLLPPRPERTKRAGEWPTVSRPAKVRADPNARSSHPERMTLCTPLLWRTVMFPTRESEAKSQLITADWKKKKRNNFRFHISNLTLRPMGLKRNKKKTACGIFHLKKKKYRKEKSWQTLKRRSPRVS